MLHAELYLKVLVKILDERVDRLVDVFLCNLQVVE
jgi:hypothetical protein